MKTILSSFIILLLFVIACSNPQALLKKGRYESAYKMALKEMDSKKVAASDTIVLIRALEGIIEKELPEFWTNEAKNDIEYWDKAQRIGAKLQDKITKSNPYTNHKFAAAFDTIEVHRQQLNHWSYDFNKMQAFDHLQQFKDTELTFHAQDAYKYLEAAQRYLPQETELDSLKQFALDNAVYYYAVSASASFEIMSNWSIDQAFSGITSKSGRFQEIVYGHSSNADCSVHIDFGFLSENKTESVVDKEFTKEIQVGTETQTDTSGVVTMTPIYETINGNVKETTITKRMDWSASARVTSYSKNCNLSGSSFSASASQTIEKYEISGDHRTIPPEYFGKFPKSFDDNGMKQEMIDAIYSQFAGTYF